MKVRRLILPVFVIGPLLIVALLAFVAATESGTRLIAELVLERVSGMRIGAEIRGRLIDRLRISELRVEADGLLVEVPRVDFDWNPWALISGRLSIALLRLDQPFVAIEAREGAPASTTGPPTLPAIPLMIDLARFEMRGLRLDDAQADPVIDRLAARLRARSKGIEISELVVDSPRARLGGRLRVASGDPLRLQGALAIVVEREGDAIAIDLEVDGPLDALKLRAHSAAPVTTSIAGTVDVAAAVPGLQLEGTVEVPVGDDPPALRAGPVEFSVAGDTQALQLAVALPLVRAGQPPWSLGADADIRQQDGKVTGSFAWRADSDGPEVWRRPRGRGEFEFEGDALTVRQETQQPLSSVLALNVVLSGDVPALQAELTAGTLELAAPGGRILRLDGASLGVKGMLDALQLTLTATGSEQQYGPVSINLASRVNATTQQVHIDTLEARALGGLLRVTGEVQAGPVTRVKVDATGSELNLAIIEPTLDSRLDLGLSSNLALDENGIKGTVELRHARGEWRRRRLSAAGRAALDGKRVSLEGFEVELGRNTIAIDAELADALSGRFRIALEDFGEFLEGASGRLVGTGTLAGTPIAPVVASVLEGEGLSWGDWSLARIGAEVDLDLSRETEQAVVIELVDLQQGETAFGDLGLRLSGATGDHVLTLDAGREDARMSLRAEGRWRNEAWTGRLATWTVGLGRYGAWALEAPAALELRVAESSVIAAPGCLVSGLQKVCYAVPGLDAEAGSAELSLHDLSLDLLADFLPTHVVATGAARGRASFKRTETGDEIFGDLSLVDTAIALTTASGELERVRVRDFVADFSTDGTQLNAKLAADVGEWLVLEASLAGTPRSDGAIAAQLEATAATLAWVEEFVPDIAGTRGSARIELDVSGKLPEPQLRLAANLTAGAIAVPLAGLKLTTFDLAVDRETESLALLSLKLGNADGLLDVEGQVNPSAPTWPGRASVFSERFGAVRLPEAEADVAPQLELDFSREHLDVRGRVALPKVHVDVREVPPGAVTVSEDEVIVGGETDAREPEPGFFERAVTGDVELVVGEDVVIDAVGLHAKLGGAMRWTKQRGDSIGRGEGRISILSGGYKAYGQNLVIERGHLTFGGPIDNPSLDVQAVRGGIGVKAGLRVTGEARDPRLDLFSEPPMPDAEILAYIITGRGMDSASSGDAGLITSAALSLGSERASMITSQVASAFGLDEFAVNTGDSVDATTFTAGKRLTPKLSVRSQFSPFDRLWSFFLNYKLTERWSVEAESGVRQGADVIYSVESDRLIPENLPRPSEWFD